jgi:hypothetical protein
MRFSSGLACWAVDSRTALHMDGSEILQNDEEGWEILEKEIVLNER